MKRIILSLACLGLITVGSTKETHAQVDKSFYKTPYKSRNIGSFGKSTNVVTLGYGFPNLSGTGWAGWGSNRVSIGPAYLKYEHGIRDEIGIGGYVAGAASRVKYSGNRYTDRVTAFSMGILGYYHFNKIIPVRNLDVYAGVGIGFRNRSYTYDAVGNWRNDYTDFNVMPLLKVGARYYFTPFFGVYAESGYDNMSSGNIGISFRF